MAADGSSPSTSQEDTPRQGRARGGSSRAPPGPSGRQDRNRQAQKRYRWVDLIP